MKKKTLAKRIELIIEFAVFGIIVGVIEDLIAVKFATGEPITMKIVGIVVLITIPFAIISELIVDNIDIAGFVHRLLHKKSS